MKPFDLVIKGGDAILPGRGRTVCDIAIHGGKIAAILPPGEAVPAKEELLARGLVVMPGAVDVHLHLGHGKDIARPRANRWTPTVRRRRPQGAASPPLFLI
jgi:dihydropyrimidinase